MSKLYIVIGGSESGHSDFAALLAAQWVADRWIDSEQFLVGAPKVTAQMQIAAATGPVKLLLDKGNDVAFSIPLAGAAIIEPFAVSFRESGHVVAIINFNNPGVVDDLMTKGDS